MTRGRALEGHCRDEHEVRPLHLGSLKPYDLVWPNVHFKHTGVRDSVDSVLNQVARLANLAKEAGMDGVVASPLEIARIRRECGKNLLLVVPGVRPQGGTWDDQKRVLTPEEAMRSGADYLVVGKPIRDAKDPRQATRQIVSAMEQGLASPSGRTVHLFRGGTAR